MNRILNRFLSVLLPHRCTFCNRFIKYDNDKYICDSCMDLLPFIKGRRCAKCNAPISQYAVSVCLTCRKYKYRFSGSFTPLLYKGAVRKSIIRMKFYQRNSYAKSYAYLIADSIISNGFPDIDFITYIPLSDESYAKRGFNQSQLIAEQCGKILSLPVYETLIRINGTPRQSTLSANQRHLNAKRAFKCKDIKLKGVALLIDDIYTTGSTMGHTSSLLLKMGCDKVYIAAVALKEKSGA